MNRLLLCLLLTVSCALLAFSCRDSEGKGGVKPGNLAAVEVEKFNPLAEPPEVTYIVHNRIAELTYLKVELKVSVDGKPTTVIHEPLGGPEDTDKVLAPGVSSRAFTVSDPALPTRTGNGALGYEVHARILELKTAPPSSGR